MKTLNAVTMVVLIGSLLVGGACRERSSEARSGEESPAIPVTVATVEERLFSYNVRTVGTLFALHESHIGSKVAGRVAEIYVEESDEVKKGDPLLKLEQEDFRDAMNQAEAAVKAAEAALANVLAGTRKEDIATAKAAFELAETEYNRMKDLWETRSIPKARFDAAEAQYKTAKETYEKAVRGPREEDINVARAQVDQARAALEVAKTKLADSVLRAPFDGVIVGKYANVGEMVGPTRVLFREVDISRIKVEADIPETEFAYTRVGTPAFVSVDVYPGEEFQGSVTRVNPSIDPMTRTFHVEMESPNPDGRLKPGMFARLRLEVRQERKPGVPMEALNRLPATGVYYAFAVVDGKAQKVNVTLGLREGNWVAIEEGLSVGAQVVTSGSALLQTGRRVTIVTESGEKA
jgi:multidrug efflux pump subunit AcrA (membrane-fusion protein)